MNGLMKRALKAVAGQAGVEIVRISPVATTEHRRLTMMTNHGINVAVDVGANLGQFGSMLRRNGYRDEMVSFEPMRAVYSELEKRARPDPKWRVFNTAIGAENGEAEINISPTHASSSILPMMDLHVRNAPGSQYVSKERVRVSTLDSALGEVLSNGSHVLLKIDTQGYEHHVIHGIKSILSQIHLIECELSLATLYEGQYLFPEMIDLLEGIGFRPVHLEPGFSDRKTGYCLQVYGIFARSV
jgi:FkbM family methyltransferase